MNLDKISLQHVVVIVFGICATLLAGVGRLPEEKWMYIALIVLGYTLKNGVSHANGKKSG